MDDEEINIDDGEPMMWAITCWAFCFVLGAGMVVYHLLEAMS